MDALLDLEPVLRSKKEQLTPQEQDLLRSCRDRARRDFYGGCSAGAFVSFLVTKKLPKNPRIAILTSASVVSGLCLCMRSLDLSVEHLLSLQGTRIQGELAQIMLKKHQNDPRVRERVAKYFYPEVVYNDSSVDRASYRWRYRNLSGDSVNLPSTAKMGSKEKDIEENDTKMATTEEIKQIYASAGGVTVEKENPFDLVFGDSESREDVSQAETSTAPKPLSRRQTRREKRTRRRHRHAHHDSEGDI